jgi:hypothetical protein
MMVHCKHIASSTGVLKLKRSIILNPKIHHNNRTYVITSFNFMSFHFSYRSFSNISSNKFELYFYVSIYQSHLQ